MPRRFTDSIVQENVRSQIYRSQPAHRQCTKEIDAAAETQIATRFAMLFRCVQHIEITKGPTKYGSSDVMICPCHHILVLHSEWESTLSDIIVPKRSSGESDVVVPVKRQQQTITTVQPSPTIESLPFKVMVMILSNLTKIADKSRAQRVSRQFNHAMQLPGWHIRGRNERGQR